LTHGAAIYPRVRGRTAARPRPRGLATASFERFEAGLDGLKAANDLAETARYPVERKFHASLAIGVILRPQGEWPCT
jgi:hypothetical protein